MISILEFQTNQLPGNSWNFSDVKPLKLGISKCWYIRRSATEMREDLLTERFEGPSPKKKGGKHRISIVTSIGKKLF